MQMKMFKVLLAIALLTFFDTLKGQPKRPNILVILSDDHAQQAISAYGGSLMQTPHIDRIAKEGAIFRNSFVTNSICAPKFFCYQFYMCSKSCCFPDRKIQPYEWPDR
jgi:hypothetical protein